MQELIQDTIQTTTKRYQCRHIFTDGHRCGSPCLRYEEFCYYHHTTRRPVEDLAQRRSRQSRFDLALPEDRSAIQCSIGEVLRRIAGNEIDSKRAGLLLYGLQIASLNLPRIKEPTRDQAPVEEIVAHPKLGTLAPRTEVGKQEQKESSLIALIRENLAQAKAEADAEKAAKAKAEEETARAAAAQAAKEAAQTEPAKAAEAAALAEIEAPEPEAVEAPQTPNPNSEILPIIQASEAPTPNPSHQPVLNPPSSFNPRPSVKSAVVHRPALIRLYPSDHRYALRHLPDGRFLFPESCALT